MYLNESAEECVANGDHLKDCDENGYCNNCGHQDAIEEDS